MGNEVAVVSVFTVILDLEEKQQCIEWKGDLRLVILVSLLTAQSPGAGRRQPVGVPAVWGETVWHSLPPTAWPHWSLPGRQDRSIGTASRERAFSGVTGEALRAWPKVTVTIPPRDSVWAGFTSGQVPVMRGAWSPVLGSSSSGLLPERGTASVQAKTAPILLPARSPLFCVNVDSSEVRKITFGEKGEFQWLFSVGGVGLILLPLCMNSDFLDL